MAKAGSGDANAQYGRGSVCVLMARCPGSCAMLWVPVEFLMLNQPLPSPVRASGNVYGDWAMHRHQAAHVLCSRAPPKHEIRKQASSL